MTYIYNTFLSIEICIDNESLGFYMIAQFYYSETLDLQNLFCLESR